MRKPKTAEEAYNSCLADGHINEIKQINIDKVKALVENAETNISTAKIIKNAIDKQAKEWLNVFITYYEALRIYTEALLIFDKVGIANHQCLFAFLCIKHPELELNWNFFQKIRTKRNGINYYGENLSYADWKEVEVQINLYINAIKKEVEKKLKKFQ